MSAFAQALRRGNKFARLSITLMIAFAVALSGVGMKLYLAKAQGVPRVTSIKPKITSVERYDGKPGPPPTETRLNWGSTTEGIVRFVIKGSNL
ncbi:MAG: hypothetical protein HZRFUVUK_001541, partial [Candidatus Fervidibacterota bacterium]